MKIHPIAHTIDAKPRGFPPCLWISVALAAMISPKIPKYKPARPRTVPLLDMHSSMEATSDGVKTLSYSAGGRPERRGGSKENYLAQGQPRAVFIVPTCLGVQIPWSRTSKSRKRRRCGRS